MMRGLILLLLGVALTLAALPFLLTSRALDERDITIPGHVYHKGETIRVAYSGWERSRDATIEYSIPETGGVSFFNVHPDTQHYDAMHTHQPWKYATCPAGKFRTCRWPGCCGRSTLFHRFAS